MVFIEINGTKFDFVSASSPFNFGYDVSKNRIYQDEGNLFIHRFFISSDFIKNLNEIKTLKLFDEKGNEFDFLNYDFLRYDIRKDLECDTCLTISIQYRNVFDVYANFLSEIGKMFKKPGQTYDCFVTSNLCNLSCPYCFQGKDHNKSEYKLKLDYQLYDKEIKKIVELNKLLGTDYTTTRIMGGEPFLNMETFKYVFEYHLTVIPKVDDLWIYTNYTINTDEFLDYIDYMLTRVRNITVVVTSDSLDYNKSVRIPNKELMSEYIKNIEKLVKKYGKEPRVRIATNIIYLDYETTLKTVRDMIKLGVEYIQMGYDEFTNPDNSEEIQSNLAKIFALMEKEGTPRLKINLGKTMWVHFSITDADIEIYRSKPAFHTDYVVSKMNDY